MKKWNAKKILCLAGAIVYTLLLFVPAFLPVFRCADRLDSNIYYCGNVITFFTRPWRADHTSVVIGLGLAPVAAVLAVVNFIKSIRAKSDVGDAEDKGYVFGFFFATTASVLIAIGCFAGGAYIYSAIAFTLTLLGIGAVILHFKKLSSF